MKKTWLTASAVFSLFLIWMIVSTLMDNPLLLPGPGAVFSALVEILTETSGLSAIGATLLRLALAMTVALVSGLFLGVWAGLKPAVGTFLRPLVTLLRTVPVISIVVIVLILAGFEKTPYVITFLMIFPLFYQGISEGVAGIDPELVEVYQLDDNRFWTGLRYCYLPLIQNHIKTALLQSAGLGIKVLVMAEFLAQTQNSIGNRLYLDKVNLEYDRVFAWTIVLIIIAVILETLIENHVRNRSGAGTAFPGKRSKLD